MPRATAIVIFPGSRKHEVANLFPLFVRVALNLRRMLPGVADRVRAARRS